MYEYRMEEIRIWKDVAPFNEIAADGWRFVAFINHIDGRKYLVLFEREVKD